jgi:hypothetical protein
LGELLFVNMRNVTSTSVIAHQTAEAVPQCLYGYLGRLDPLQIAPQHESPRIGCSMLRHRHQHPVYRIPFVRHADRIRRYLVIAETLSLLVN